MAALVEICLMLGDEEVSRGSARLKRRVHLLGNGTPNAFRQAESLADLIEAAVAGKGPDAAPEEMAAFVGLLTECLHFHPGDRPTAHLALHHASLRD